MLHAGVAGTVYYLEADPHQPATDGAPKRRHAAPLSTAAIAARRRSSATSRDYDVSADGHKLLYRTPAAAAAVAVAAPTAPDATPSIFLVDADRAPPAAGQGRLNVTLRMYLEPKEEFKQIFNEGWRNQRDYLYVPNMHGTDWAKDKQMYGALLPYVNHRADLIT